MLPSGLLLTACLAHLARVTAFPLQSIAKRGLPKLGGINLAGCEFGIEIDGAAQGYACPDTSQIEHFTSQGANLIRLPLGWQYLVGYNLDYATFDEGFFGVYDRLVQASLGAGAFVMIDLHNYARWDGGIVGQGGPNNEQASSIPLRCRLDADVQFAKLWTNIAKRYKTQDRIIFGIMNEPHDLDMEKWGATVQIAVNAIRAAGATSQSIALPGTLYTNAVRWYEGANDAVVAVKDPAGGDNSKLILDVHQYLDGGSGGKSRECANKYVTPCVPSAIMKADKCGGLENLQKLATWLKAKGRRALISEIGGGNTPSCHTNLAQYLQFVSTDDAFIGFAAWAAGSFLPSYELSITPENGQDNDLFKIAIKPNFPNGAPAPKPKDVVKIAPPVAFEKSRRVDAAPPSVNLQKFGGQIGGSPAPEVFSAPFNKFKSGWKTFDVFLVAVQSSCYTQRDGCLDVATKSGNTAPSAEACMIQTYACLDLASASTA